MVRVAPRKIWPEASATGTLALRPVQHLLVYARAQALTGTLRLGDGGDEGGVVVFLRGRVTKVHAARAGAYLGTVAYELGLIDGPALDASLAALATRGRRHGELLLESGALTYAQLSVALMEQALRKLTYLHGLPDRTTFAFHDRFDGLPAWPADGPRTDPLPAIWRGCRDHVGATHLRDVLGRLGGGVWRLTEGTDLAELGLDADTLALAVDLKTPWTMADVLADAGGARELAERLLYVLAITRRIEPEGTAPMVASAARAERRAPRSGTYARLISFELRTPSLGQPAEVAPPPPEPPLLPPTRLEIIERARTIGRESAYEILRVAEDAGDEAIRAAYFRLSRAWRPERLAPDLIDVRERCGLVRAHMDGAYRLLGDPGARAEYDARRRAR